MPVLSRMQELMDPTMVAWVTDASGAAEPVTGANTYLSRIAAMDLPAVRNVLRVADGRVTGWWRADAKPAEIDRFWA